MKDIIGIKGKLTITLYDEQGVIKEQFTVPNLIVDVGKNFIASRMLGTSAAVMSHMAVGTSNTGSTDGTKTALVTEVGRVALTSSTNTDNENEYIATFSAGTGTGTLVEAGIFNAGSSGTMLCRTTFPAITKGASDTLTINWIITVS